MKRLIAAILCLLLLIKGNSQKDSLLVINTYKYDVSFGISEYHRTCINQKTYDLKDNLLREINYGTINESNIAIDNIIYYFYKNEKLVSEEFYNPKAELKYFIVHQYDKSGILLTKDLKVSIVNNKPFIQESNEYKNSKGQTIVIKRNDRKKIISSTTFSRSGDYTYSTTIYSRMTGLDSIVSVTDRSQTENNKTTELLEVTKYVNNQTDTLITKNEFNDKNLLSKSVIKKNGQITSKVYFEYYPNGSLKSKSVFNVSDKLVEYTSYEISKIYREFGGLKSVYLENLKGKL
jgi:hypothetical protein